ncbi:MAG: ECF transporter S component [Eubacteriales bacterium]
MKNKTNYPLSDGIDKRKRILYSITVSAVFLSFALVLKTLTSFYLPILGAAGLKVDFSGIFTAFPALMFGPLYGGAVCALADILGFLIKPSGAYIPPMTITAFASGFLIGLIWRFAVKNIKKNNRAVTAAIAVVFLLPGIFGVTLHATLNADHIINGLTADSSLLLNRGQLASAEMSPLSRFVCSLARYSNDTITIKHTADTGSPEIIAIPEVYDIDGYSYKITKIAANAFSDNNALKALFLSSNITVIDKTAFEGAEGITIYAPADSYAATYAADNGLLYTTADYDTFKALYDINGLKLNTADYDITNKYRENLAGYINFLTIGFELISLFVLIVISIGSYVSHQTSKKAINGTAPVLSREGNYIRILLAVFIPRLLITTINTEILRQYFAVWNGRAFIVLWIPRAAEEILSGILQAYIIMLLYAIYETKFKKKRIIINKIS